MRTQAIDPQTAALNDLREAIDEMTRVNGMVIAECHLVPGVTPKLESYRGFRDCTEWFVAVEGESVRDWQVTGPNRPTPAGAIEAWNAVWAVKS